MHIETSSSLFTVSSEAPEFIWLNSQQKLLKESEILQDAHMPYGSISPYKFSDKATGVLI